MLFQILNQWEEIRLKKTLDDTHFRIKKVFLKSHLKSSNHFKQSFVKNIGNCSKKRLENALRYVINNSDSKALDQNGNEVELDDILDDWKKDFSSKENSREGWHLVFSINEEVNARNMKTLKKAVKDTMEKNFFAYKYVLIKHTHQNNPHIHVIVNKNNIFTKKKMHFKTNSDLKEFFNTLRDDFSMALNYYDPKLKYQNLSKHNRDLELQKIQEDKNQDLDLNLDVEKNMKKLEVESIINFNKIEKNSEKIKELRKEQRHFLSLLRKNAPLDDVLELQKDIEKLEKHNGNLRKKNQIITKMMRDFKEVSQTDLSSPFFKKKIIDFLKKNPRMLTLKQVVQLPKLEQKINQEIQKIQSYHKTYLKQEIKHNMSLGTFQKTNKIFSGIKECQTNIQLFPEHRNLFEKNIKVLERFLEEKRKIASKKISDFGNIEVSKRILESENEKINIYFKEHKRERISHNETKQVHRKLDDIFQEISKIQNLYVDDNLGREIKTLEVMLSQKASHNEKVIGFLEKSLKSKEFLQKEILRIDEYFQGKTIDRTSRVQESEMGRA